MEGIVNGVNGPAVRKPAEVVYNGSHELVPTRNQRVMVKAVRNKDLVLPSRRKHVTISLAVS